MPIATVSNSLSAAGGGRPSALLSQSSTNILSSHLEGALRKIYESLLEPGKDALTRAQFQKFLAEVQKTPAKEDFKIWAERIFGHVDSPRPGDSSGQEGSTSQGGSTKETVQRLLDSEGIVKFEDFCDYITSPHTSALASLDPKTKDMTKPLNEYFISSSHNTYLVGHQLYGASTTEGYINVLRRGCRCIEIDVWDGDNGEPQVFHGWTLTKEISFREVCVAIRDHAFWSDAENGGEVAEGPVIISLECHASHKQQEEMVRIMKDVWGGMLVDRPILGEKDCHNVVQLPSPAQLKGKILVKTKYLPPDPPCPEPTAARESKKATSDSSTSSSSDEEMAEESRRANQPKPRKVKVVRALSDLAIYCASHTFTSFKDAAARAPGHVFSFSEKVFKSHYNTNAKTVFDHNLNHLMRVYPFGLRFNSSNGDPTYFWRKGVQLTALNWQKCDEGMMLNEGLFAGEGGYVLKPAQYRPSAGVATTLVIKKMDLEVEVIACQNVPLPDESDKPHKFEPYVKIEVHVENMSDGEEEIKACTQVAVNKGVDATWVPKRKFFSSGKEKDSKRIGEVVKFKNVNGVIGDGMLSFIRFKIHDKEIGRDDLAAWACIRLDRLQQGYRLVKLFDVKGNRSDGVLLCKIGWRWCN